MSFYHMVVRGLRPTHRRRSRQQRLRAYTGVKLADLAKMQEEVQIEHTRSTFEGVFQATQNQHPLPSFIHREIQQSNWQTSGGKSSYTEWATPGEWQKRKQEMRQVHDRVLSEGRRQTEQKPDPEVVESENRIWLFEQS